MTELKILRAEKTSSRVIVLDFREVNSIFFRVLFGRSTWEAALRGKGARAGCLSKGFLQLCKTAHRNSKRTDWLTEKLLAELKCKTLYGRWKRGWATRDGYGTAQAYIDIKARLGLKLAKDVKAARRVSASRT